MDSGTDSYRKWIKNHFPETLKTLKTHTKTVPTKQTNKVEEVQRKRNFLSFGIKERIRS